MPFLHFPQRRHGKIKGEEKVWHNKAESHSSHTRLQPVEHEISIAKITPIISTYK